MEKEFLQEILNFNLGLLGFIFMILTVRNCARVLHGNRWKLKTLKWKHLWQFLDYMGTPIFGLVIILISFALVNMLLGGVSTIPEPAFLENESNSSTLKEAVLSFGYTGFFGTTLFIAAGAFYIFSGFGAWMKWIARAFILAAVFYVFVQMFRYAVLAA